jgi:anti-anti-sigma factor
MYQPIQSAGDANSVPPLSGETATDGLPAPAESAAAPSRLTTIEASDHLLAVVQGDLDIVSTPRIGAALPDVFKQAGDRRVLLDLRQVDYLDSVGLTVLVRLCVQEKSRHPKFTPGIVLTEGSQAERVLSISRFDQLFHVGYSVSQALQSW